MASGAVVVNDKQDALWRPFNLGDGTYTVAASQVHVDVAQMRRMLQGQAVYLSKLTSVQPSNGQNFLLLANAYALLDDKENALKAFGEFSKLKDPCMESMSTADRAEIKNFVKDFQDKMLIGLEYKNLEASINERNDWSDKLLQNLECITTPEDK